MFKQFHNQITNQQLYELAGLLTADDVREITALGHTNVYHALRMSTQSSAHFTYSTLDDGTPAGVAGVVNSGDGIGVVWLLTTDAVQVAPLSFVRMSKYWLKSLSSEYMLLHNVADARNINHLKLLKLLGFKRLQYMTVGPDRRTFVEFAKLL